jgi:hypothetical protein
MVASITASQSLTARVKTVNPTFSPYPCRLGWRARLCLAAGLCALYPLAVAGPAAADDLIVPIEAPAQAATTDQSAAANGVATQDSPTNLVISVRIDSPGNDGAVSQSNVAVVTVGAGNGSETSQAGAGELGGGQQASTGQDATATGEGTQSHPINIIVSVRINSPGNDGPISQTNLVGVGVGANNGSSTSQTGATPAGNTPRVAVPRAHALRPGAAPAEAAQGKTAANDRSRQPAPRRSAPASRPADKTAEKSLGRPVSGAAAAHTAGLPAAAARAHDTKPIGKRHSEHAGGLQRAKSVLARVAHAPLPAVSPPAGQRAAGAGLLTLTVLALLGALLLWLSSTWIGPVRTAWGRRS